MPTLPHNLIPDTSPIAPPLRWASWIAVSSAPQAAEDKISIPHQRQTNLAHCARHSGELVAELLVPGESRHIPTWEDACKEIQAYAQLRDLIQRRQIDVLVFYDRTRLGRMASLIMTIEALCLRAGIALYETTNPPAEINAGYQYERSLIGAIGAVGAQQEVEKLKERRRIGMANRIQRGEFASQPNWGYYYKYDERGNRSIEIDEHASRIVKEIFRLYLSGQGERAIATLLNERGSRSPKGRLWSSATIGAILRAVHVYAGYAEAFYKSRKGTPRVLARGSWVPLISELVLRDVIAEKAARAKNRKLPVTPYRFAGVAACIECGRTMSGKSNSRADFRGYMLCSRHEHRTSLRFERIEEAIEAVIETIGRGEWGVLDQGDDALQDAEKRLADIDARRHVLEESFALADTAYINRRMDEARYNAQIETLDARKRALDAEYGSAMGDYAQESLQGAKAERLKEIAESGLEILRSPDTKASNVWLRHRFRVWCKGHEMVYVEVLF